jgi:hypothetical protein
MDYTNRPGLEHYTAQAVAAITDAARAEADLPGWLSLVLVLAAAQLGSLDALTAGRPGSWEAGHMDALARAWRATTAAWRTSRPPSPNRHGRSITDDPAGI